MTKLLQKLARVPARQQCTSTITLAELSYGAHRIGKIDLYARLRAILNELEILAFDVAAAEEYGPLRARLEKRGARLDEADLRIASIALVHGCTLVTGNVRHFALVEDLDVENWLED